MSYRTAANTAYSLALDDDPDVAKMGFRLLTDLAENECYTAMLNLMYLHSTGPASEQNLEVAEAWANRAKALHPTLVTADDLYDAGNVCIAYGLWFGASVEDAKEFFERAALLGSGLALYEICELTRATQKGSAEWTEKLAMASALGSTQAMTELAEQNGVRGTEQELVWLRAAAALGSLRAEEMLEYK
jgi:TPR repeat protein